MAPLLARHSKGNRGGVGSDSTEPAEVLALPAPLQRLKLPRRCRWRNPNANSGVNVTDSTDRLWIVTINVTSKNIVVLIVGATVGIRDIILPTVAPGRM